MINTVTVSVTTDPNPEAADKGLYTRVSIPGVCQADSVALLNVKQTEALIGMLEAALKAIQP
jgi:hypothetical protein